MPMEVYIVAIVFGSIIALATMLLHYITVWRKQSTLMPDDERMMEDLWRTAKAMEQRLETLEALINDEDGAATAPPPRPRTNYDS